jgi:hypothetical protein
MSEDKKIPIIISPKCVAGYAWLNKKDEMSDKYTITGLQVHYHGTAIEEGQGDTRGSCQLRQGSCAGGEVA